MNNFIERQLYQSHSKYSSLFLAQKICMLLAGSLSLITLSVWFVPALNQAFSDWLLMHPATAVCVLLSAIAILLIQKNQSILIIGFLSLSIFIISTITLFDFTGGEIYPFKIFQLQDNETELNDSMSAHTATFFCILAVSFIVSPQNNNNGKNIRDVLTLILISIVLVDFSSYFFNLTSLDDRLIKIHIDPVTFLSNCLLTFGNFVRGIHNGIFSPFIGYGISSYAARITLPWALLGPFAIISAMDYLAKIFGMSSQDQIAISAVLLSLMLFSIILWASTRIRYLENDLHKLALTDEMTGLYNHRAFCMLGKHAFLESLRNDSILVLLYFDLDGLKKINDSLGHQIGSEMIVEFTNLLKANFRRNETIARVGGDEFVVLSKQDEIGNALKRLANAAEAANKSGKNPYTISYSHGMVSGKAKDYASLDELLKKADALMYENKSKKKQQERLDLKAEV